MRTRWLTARAVGFHFLAAVIVVVCLLAGRWQLHAALGGNTLSWAYTVEWPVFAAIALVAWWHLIHEDPIERAERAEKAARAVVRQRRAETGGAPTAPDRPRSWREAAIDAYDWDEVSEADAARVAAAARHEYLAHVARLAADDESDTWHRPGSTS